jgi:hypothetical protein
MLMHRMHGCMGCRPAGFDVAAGGRDRSCLLLAAAACLRPLPARTALVGTHTHRRLPHFPPFRHKATMKLGDDDEVDNPVADDGKFEAEEGDEGSSGADEPA